MNNALTVLSLTERLKKGEDVTLKEARYIADLIEERTPNLNPRTKTFDCDLHAAVLEWFTVAADRLPAHGNFVCSIVLDEDLNEYLPLDVFLSLERCRERLLFPDGVYKMECLIPKECGREIKTVFFERAGSIRHTRFFEELKKMKKLPGNVNCSSYFSVNPKDYVFYVNKKNLLYISAVQSTCCLLIHAFSACYSGGLPLMYASDLKDHFHVPYIMSRNPDEIVLWAKKAGYIDEETAQSLLRDGSIDSEKIDLVGICNGFAEYCRERCMYDRMNETLEDDSWTDVIR